MILFFFHPFSIHYFHQLFDCKRILWSFKEHEKDILNQDKFQALDDKS